MNNNKAKIHTDIKSDGWIERFLPSRIRPFAYLMRLDRPIGIWLLLFPGLWAIMLVSGGGASIDGFIIYMVVLFYIGAVIMRGAGCIINDLWDRKLDQKVERTAMRPLAAGTISVKQALIFLLLLLMGGFAILWQMSLVTILLGFMVFPLIVLYPLMKRWTWWPQAFLGLTFNFGALMGWTAVNDIVSPSALFLYGGGIFWTLGYDTIYAHQDKEDDFKVGIKSTALKLGENSRNYVTIFYVIAMTLFYGAFINAGAGTVSLVMLALAGFHLIWQIRIWDIDSQESALHVFKSNRVFGALVLLAAIL